MKDPQFWDFMMEGGDELLNTEPCPHCGNVIYLDQECASSANSGHKRLIFSL